MSYFAVISNALALFPDSIIRSTDLVFIQKPTVHVEFGLEFDCVDVFEVGVGVGLDVDEDEVGLGFDVEVELELEIVGTLLAVGEILLCLIWFCVMLGLFEGVIEGDILDKLFISVNLLGVFFMKCTCIRLREIGNIANKSNTDIKPEELCL